MGLAFFAASDPVGFLLPVGTEPGVRVGGVAVATGRVVLAEPGLGAGDGGEAVGWGGLCVPVRAGAGSLARPLILASVWTTRGKGFLEALAAGCRGRALGGGGRGVTRFRWIGFPVGRDAWTGTGRSVGGAGFLVGGAAFLEEGRAAFWVGRGLLAGAVGGAGAAGLVGRLLGALAAVLFCKDWAGVGEPAGGARGAGGSSRLADSLAGGSGVRAGSPTETRLGGSVVLVLRGLAGVGGTAVPLSPLPAGREPRAGVAVVRLPRPSRARSVWKAKGAPASRGRRAGPRWGRYMSACPHGLLRWVQ